MLNLYDVKHNKNVILTHKLLSVKLQQAVVCTVTRFSTATDTVPLNQLTLLSSSMIFSVVMNLPYLLTDFLLFFFFGVYF